MDRIIFVDTETGGVDPSKHSLLSVGLVAWDYNDGIIDTIEIFIKQDQYTVTKEAQKLNKFDIETHEKKAVPPLMAINAIKGFSISNTNRTNDIQLAGHNIQFDVSFLKKLFKDQNKSFNQLFSHRMIDTYSVLKFLQDADKINLDHISSASAFRLFHIKVDGRHSALGDAIATAQLYGELLKLV